jgi:hypothetical protein
MMKRHHKMRLKLKLLMNKLRLQQPKRNNLLKMMPKLKHKRKQLKHLLRKLLLLKKPQQSKHLLKKHL